MEPSITVPIEAAPQVRGRLVDQRHWRGGPDGCSRYRHWWPPTWAPRAGLLHAGLRYRGAGVDGPGRRAEVEAYIAALAGERDDAGRRLVVRNGHAKSRQVTTVAGAIEVHAPRVDDRRVDQATGQRCRFRSSILPPWCRRSPKVTEVLPLLYLHGLSSKDFVPALEEFFGTSAGLSASVVTRLTSAWQQEYRQFAERDLAGVDYVYVWVDGIHFKVRLE